MLRTCALSIFLLSSCTNAPIDTSAVGPFEGDDPGECTDGADNDRDDYFDCDDSDCFGSPDCSGEASDADTDTDTDTDADTDTDTDDDYSAITVSYVLDWDIDDAKWSGYGFTDCTQVYSGSGTVVETEGLRLTFFGDWTQDSSDCGDDLDATVWYDPTTREGHNTVYLTPDLRAVDAWVLHEDLSDSTPDGEPSDKFYIYDMDAMISGSQSAYEEDEEIRLDGIYYFATLHHDLQITLE